jgi:histone-lysine N-methyltransferase SETMAR
MLRTQLKPAVQRKRRGLLSSGLCLQRDKAQFHTARFTEKENQDLKLEVLPHPPYSPDLAPSNFHLFWPLKVALLGRNFRSNEEVKRRCVTGWYSNQKISSPEEFML